MVLLVSESDARRQTAQGFLKYHPYCKMPDMNIYVCSCFNAKAL